MGTTNVAEMTTTFHLSKKCRRTAIWTLVFFVTIAVASTWVACDAPADRRIYAVTLFSVFWGTWACGSMWLLVACWRANLEIDEDRVVWHGVIGKRQIVLSEVSMVRWRPNNDSVTLGDRTSRLTICLRDFESTDRLRLIRFLRSSLPDAIQENWKMFCYRVALPLRSEAHPVSDAPDEDQILITRRRWNWYFAPVILISTLIGVMFWWMRGEPKGLLTPLPTALLWLWLRFSTPRKGMPATRLSARPDARRFIIMEFVWLGIGLGGICLFRLLNLPLVLGLVALTAWLGPLLWQAYLLDQKQKKCHLVKSEAAVRLWDERESNLAKL